MKNLTIFLLKLLFGKPFSGTKEPLLPVVRENRISPTRLSLIPIFFLTFCQEVLIIFCMRNLSVPFVLTDVEDSVSLAKEQLLSIARECRFSVELLSFSKTPLYLLQKGPFQYFLSVGTCLLQMLISFAVVESCENTSITCCMPRHDGGGEERAI